MLMLRTVSATLVIATGQVWDSCAPGDDCVRADVLLQAAASTPPLSTPIREGVSGGRGSAAFAAESETDHLEELENASWYRIYSCREADPTLPRYIRNSAGKGETRRPDNYGLTYAGFGYYCGDTDGYVHTTRLKCELINDVWSNWNYMGTTYRADRPPGCFREISAFRAWYNTYWDRSYNHLNWERDRDAVTRRTIQICDCIPSDANDVDAWRTWRERR